MAKAKQLTVSCENRPGTLAHVARVLGDAKVNILTFLTTTSGADGSVQVVVDNVRKAKKGNNILASGGKMRENCCLWAGVSNDKSIGTRTVWAFASARRVDVSEWHSCFNLDL